MKMICKFLFISILILFCECGSIQSGNSGELTEWKSEYHNLSIKYNSDWEPIMKPIDMKTISSLMLQSKSDASSFVIKVFMKKKWKDLTNQERLEKMAYDTSHDAIGSEVLKAEFTNLFGYEFIHLVSRVQIGTGGSKNHLYLFIDKGYEFLILTNETTAVSNSKSTELPIKFQKLLENINWNYQN